MTYRPSRASECFYDLHRIYEVETYYAGKGRPFLVTQVTIYQADDVGQASHEIETVSISRAKSKQIIDYAREYEVSTAEAFCMV